MQLTLSPIIAGTTRRKHALYFRSSEGSYDRYCQRHPRRQRRHHGSGDGNLRLDSDCGYQHCQGLQIVGQNFAALRNRSAGGRAWICQSPGIPFRSFPRPHGFCLCRFDFGRRAHVVPSCQKQPCAIRRYDRLCGDGRYRHRVTASPGRRRNRADALHEPVGYAAACPVGHDCLRYNGCARRQRFYGADDAGILSKRSGSRQSANAGSGGHGLGDDGA